MNIKVAQDLSHFEGVGSSMGRLGGGGPNVLCMVGLDYVIMK